MAHVEEKVAAHDATLAQMHARLGAIETRLEGQAGNALVIGLTLGLSGWISANVARLAWWTR